LTPFDCLNRTLSLSAQPARKPLCSLHGNQECSQLCNPPHKPAARRALCSQLCNQSATGTFAFADRKRNTRRRGLPLTQLVCWKVDARTPEPPIPGGKVGPPRDATLSMLGANGRRHPHRQVRKRLHGWLRT
jgi:hypothetical protein